MVVAVGAVAARGGGAAATGLLLRERNGGDDGLSGARDRLSGTGDGLTGGGDRVADGPCERGAQLLSLFAAEADEVAGEILGVAAGHAAAEHGVLEDRLDAVGGEHERALQRIADLPEGVAYLFLARSPSRSHAGVVCPTVGPIAGAKTPESASCALSHKARAVVTRLAYVSGVAVRRRSVARAASVVARPAAGAPRPRP